MIFDKGFERVVINIGGVSMDKTGWCGGYGNGIGGDTMGCSGMGDG